MSYQITVRMYIFFNTCVGPPQFKQMARNVTVQENMGASFVFQPCAGPSPTFSWSRLTILGEEALPGAHNHIHVNSNTLTLDYTSFFDTGVYTYSVSNSYGTAENDVYLVVFGMYLYIYIRTYVCAICTSKKLILTNIIKYVCTYDVHT